MELPTAITVDGKDEPAQKILADRRRVTKLKALTQEGGNPVIEEGVTELEKTETEKRIIRNLNLGATRVLESLGFRELKVDEDLIHMITQEDFTTICQRSGDEWTALFRDGHTLIPHLGSHDDECEFILNLSHEMAHQLSYIRRNVNLHRDGIDMYAERRRGLGFSTKDRRGFVGVNEAVTELFSVEMRAAYCDFTGEDRDELVRPVAYLPTIYIMEKVFDLLSPNSREEGCHLFFKSLLTGDLSIFKTVEAKHRGMTKVLAEMGGTTADARSAAVQLGFTDVIEQIDHAIREGIIPNS